MRIEFQSGEAKDNSRQRDFDRIKNEEYTILSDSQLHFIQSWKMDDPPWGYILEYQNGSPNDHYRVLGGPIGLHRIVAAFTKYLARDASWQQDFTWGKMNPTDWSVEESVRPLQWIAMRDREFEWFLKGVFESLGYQVEMTKASGDQGVDLIVSGDDRRLAVQAKGYANKVRNDSVQQVHAGMTYYKCQECAVITNNRFSRLAKELATHVGCVLIDRDDIRDLIAGRHPWAMAIRVDGVGEVARTVVTTEYRPQQSDDAALGNAVADEVWSLGHTLVKPIGLTLGLLFLSVVAAVAFVGVALIVGFVWLLTWLWSVFG